MSARARLVAGVSTLALLWAAPAGAAPMTVSTGRLTDFRTCVITATPATTTAVADAGVNQLTPTTNSGTATSASIVSSLNTNQRVYVSFDLTRCRTSIPTTATVTSATLRLFVSVVPATCRTIDVFRSTGSWTEGGITWNNQPLGSTVNQPPTGNRTTSLAIGAVSCTNTAANTYYSLTVTSDVAAFVAGSQSNYGWMLRDDAENSALARTMTITTKNAGTLAQAPQLIVVYAT
jgi:hypothetical protein